MTHILLIGAGFSHNWKGWLADEIAGDLSLRIASDAYLSRVLKEADGFEAALMRLQDEGRMSVIAEAAARLTTFERALMDTFASMNAAFAKRLSFEFSNDISFSVSKFLARFDAIFSLNQDLLLETHYFPAMMIAGYPRWSGVHFPGVKPFPDGSGRTGAAAMLRQPDTTLQLPTNIQPIFKLHGSVNWRTGDGAHLLVMGGNKASTIWHSSVLQRYADEFERRLSTPGVRLMVIGYGFRDRHINDIIYRAWQRSGFRLFLVGPDGPLAIRKANATCGKPLYCPEPLDEIPIAGYSTRPLSGTFDNTDSAEHEKLLRFFAT